MKTELKRKDAARFIEEVLLFIAKLEAGEVVKNDPKQMQLGIGNRLRTIASTHGITDIPRKCTGEAHSNPHVDNCGVCMPNWGWSCKEVKIR